MTTLTPKKAPAGTRAIVKDAGYATYLFEVVVVEWSNAGRVNLRYGNGNTRWYDLTDIPRLVEILEQGAICA